MKHLGISANIKRAAHWGVGVTQNNQIEQIKKSIISSGELFNKNKERLIILEPNDSSVYLLVRYKDDFEGQYKLAQTAIKEINSLKKGTLWKITAEHDTIQKEVESILATHILFNQFSQECYLMRI